MARCILSMPAQLNQHRFLGASWLQGPAGVQTLMSQIHLHLERLEFVGEAGTGLCAHLFVGPLLETVELLVDIHNGGRGGVEARRGCGGDSYSDQWNRYLLAGQA